MRTAALAMAILAFAAGCHRSTAASEPLVVSAASDLQRAFTEIGPAFEARTGTRVTFNFGSTGELAQQIDAGAPVDVFAAANVSYVDSLEKKGRLVQGTKAIYARGRITLWTQRDSSARVERIEDLAHPGVKRVAIANPDIAPYGAAAREAMKNAGVWEAVQPKLVLGENIQQTMQFARTGNVDVAVVSLSLSLGTNGRYVVVPQELYSPIDQAMAVVKRTTHEKEARAFVEFVTQGDGRTIMKRDGFILPGEQPPT